MVWCTFQADVLLIYKIGVVAVVVVNYVFALWKLDFSDS